MKRIVIAGLGLLGFLAVMTAYVALPVIGELGAARAILAKPVADITDGDLARARSHLRAAREHLDGAPASLLSAVPVAAQNVAAVGQAVDAVGPVLDSAVALRSSTDELLDRGMVEGGGIDLEAFEALRAPLAEQQRSLDALVAKLREARSGWLIPRVWDGVDEVLGRAEELRSSVHKGRDGLALLEPMLGGSGERTYLVVLMNNAELRGAGGLLTGLGTIAADRGIVQVGKFDYYVDLQGPKPYRDVEAPADIERRFGRYRADKTAWGNTTASPDVPEVAVTATRLYEVSTGTAVDGVVLIDPLGIQAMLPPQRTLEIPQTDDAIRAGDLARYVYVDAYAEFDAGDPRRRRVLLALGRAALEAAFEDGGFDRSVLEAMGAAAAGGHISLFSGIPSEQDRLERIGVARDLLPTAADNVLVTMQNFGADKLEPYIERSIDHSCAVEGEGASCTASVSLTNSAPEGLPAYVVQTDKPSYAYYEGYLEIYVPEAARLSWVEVDREPVTYYPEVEDRRRSVGMMIGLERGASLTAEVAYELPLEGGYSLEIDPQPLVNEASLTVELETPAGWQTSGPDGDAKGPLAYEGSLSSSIRFEALPDGDRTGLSALWWRLQRFWSEPIL